MKQTYYAVFQLLEEVMNMRTNPIRPAVRFVIIKSVFAFLICVPAYNPVYAQVTDYAPVASNVTSSTITTVGRQKIQPLLAFDAEGPIKSYTLESVPSRGALYIGSTGGSALTTGKSLTPAEASDLYYTPSTILNLGMMPEEGIRTFQYKATDINNTSSELATYTIPIGNINRPTAPTPATMMASRMSNSGGEVKIRDLMSTGGNVNGYRITSIPAGADGILYTISEGSSSPTAISGQRDLTLAEAQNLWFAPASGYLGRTSFNYSARSADNNTYSSDATYFVPVVTASDMLPMPVELVSFKATTKSNGFVSLLWLVASETNNDYFEIERSADNQHFIAIGKMDGRGTASTKHRYVFEDAVLKSGTYYYRLKQVDFDGTTEYSKTVMASVLYEHESGLTIYPNPTHGKLTVDLSSVDSKAVQIQVINPCGQEVLALKENIKTGQNKVNLSFEGGKKGFYIVRVTGDGLSFSKRVLLE